MRSRIIGFLIFCLVTLSFWQCETNEVGQVPKTIRGDLALLPDSSIGVGYINLKSLRESPFYSDFEESLFDRPFKDPEYQEFQGATDFDVRTDLDEIYFSLNTKDNIHGDPQMLVSARGRFNEDKIIDFVNVQSENHEVGSMEYGDYTLYIPKEKKLIFCFPDQQRLVFGSEDLVKNWLDRYSSTSDENLNKNLSRQLDMLEYKNGAWFILDTEPIMERITEKISQHPEGRRFQGITALQHLNFSADFDDNLKFSSVGRFSDQEKAQLFHDAVKGAIATAKLTMSADRQAVDVLNKIKVSNDNDKIRIRFELTPEDIKKIQEKKKEIAHLPNLRF
jgi:hypothetical protein